MGLNAIVSDLSGALSNLANAFGDGKSGHPYDPDVAATVSNVGVIENDRSWRKSLGYGFRVIREGKSAESAKGWKDFIFQINPQDLTQDEIFAIEVTPTFSGVLVEHQGITLKDISISGTTGISPNRTAGGAHGSTGAPVAAAGRSGYYEFQELRTFLRSYVEAKRKDVTGEGKGDESAELRLVWMNFKDHESLYVEPQRFTMKRNSSRPFLYDYSIALKAIGIVDVKRKTNEYEDFDDAIEEGMDALDSVSRTIEGAAGFAERVTREINSTILEPFRKIRDIFVSARGLETRLSRLKLVTRKDIDKLSREIMNISDDVNDYLGREVDEYNAAKGRVVTLKAKQKMTRAIHAYHNALLKARRAIDKIKMAFGNIQLNELTWGEQNTDDQKSQTQKLIQQIYDQAESTRKRAANESLFLSKQRELYRAKQIGDAATVASLQEELDELTIELTDAGSEIVLSSTKSTSKSVIIDGNMTLQTFAAKYFPGNDSAWRDIAIRNNLKPPYIDPNVPDNPNDRVPGVLYPGDQVLIPSPGSAVPIVVVQPDLYPISRELTAFERSLATDIKLTDDFDIAIGVDGDLDLAATYENVAQALILKILTEKGSLIHHKNIGTDIGIGRKTTVLDQTSDQIRASVSTDTRIDSVIFVDIKQEGNTTLIDMVIKMKGQDIPLSIPIDKAVG